MGDFSDTNINDFKADDTDFIMYDDDTISRARTAYIYHLMV